MKKYIEKLKQQLVMAVLMVCVSAIALTSATYAWYISNNSVKATSSTIAAKGNGFVLQIVNAGGDRDYSSDEALSAITSGHDISPASTNDCVTWYVPRYWNDTTTKVTTYQNPPSLQEDGTYTIASNNYYAYCVAAYDIFTLTNTGTADVYLDNSAVGGAIQVSVNGTKVSDKVAASLRVGIVIDDVLKLVYAPIQETGTGNDNIATAGWSTVKDTISTQAANYHHVYATTYIDEEGTNWAVQKNGDAYVLPDNEDNCAIAENVTAVGVTLKIYVWMEGTDSDCINNVVNDDDSLYNVIINLAGVAK